MNAAIAGGTGLIGSFLTQFLAEDESYCTVQFVGRRKVNLPKKFKHIGLDQIHEMQPVDVGFCALGTTIAKAGSQEAFRKIDEELVLSFAHSCKNVGARSFILVSSVGATKLTANFYLRVKGEVEEAIKGIGFDHVAIMQPSLLLGPRQEQRFGESIGKRVMCAIDPLMLGPMDRYRGINAATVARAMINSVDGERVEVLENAAIREAAGESY